MHVIWFWIRLLMILAVLIFAGATIVGVAAPVRTFSPFVHRWDEVYTGNFTSGAVELNQTTGYGSATYRTWSGPGYKMVMHMRAMGVTEAQARRLAARSIKVEQGEGGIKVDGAGWFPKAASDVELYLPVGPEYHVQAKTGTGAVKLEGESYAIARVHTVNGSFEGTGVIAELEANVSIGSIRMAPTGSGRWTSTTRMGAISINTGNLGETGIMVDANTRVGSMVMEIGGQRMEQKGGGGRAPLRMATLGYEQAPKQLFIQARTNLGAVTVLPNQ